MKGASVVGNRKSAEHVGAELRVVGAQVAGKKNEHADGLGPFTQDPKQGIGIAAPRIPPLVIERER